MKVVNFDQIKNMVLNNASALNVINPQKIGRTKNRKTFTCAESKIYQIVHTKPKTVAGTYDTVPYGFKRPRLNS